MIKPPPKPQVSIVVPEVQIHFEGTFTPPTAASGESMDGPQPHDEAPPAANAQPETSPCN